MLTAAIIFVALLAGGGAAAVLLNRSLVSSLDDAAARRTADISAALRSDSLADVDAPLLETDQRIVAVQIVAPNGTVVRRSRDAPATPLVPLASIGPTNRVGIPVDSFPDNDMRVSGRTVDTAGGRYTVLVAGGSEAIESTMRNAAILLLGAAPVVVAVAAAASYQLTRRSLRSVDAIRSQVAAISTSDLSERVPVPPSRDEIAALAQTMNDMLSRIDAGHRAQRQFVGDASHELRSPLTAIISALDVAVAHPHLLDLDLARETLVPEAQRMRSLLEDLLLLARADERGLGLHREPVQFDELVRGEVARLSRTCTKRVTVSTEPVQLTADGSALLRMVRNLLDNAARHAASQVEVCVRERDGEVTLVVGDDGPGIPVADRQRVFDRFVRLDPDRSRQRGGTGLGLAIVAEIVGAHRGRAHVSDRDGGGTAVTVQLPVTDSPERSR